mgnify:FL=1
MSEYSERGNSDSDSDSDNVAAKDGHSVDTRPKALRQGFDTKKQAVDAIKFEAVKQGKSLMFDVKKSSSRSIVLGCTDRLKKNATGTCPASVRATRLKDNRWHVSQKACNMEHVNCNGWQRITARMLANNNEIKIAVFADGSISGKSLQTHVAGH